MKDSLLDDLAAAAALLDSKDVPVDGRHIIIPSKYYEELSGTKPVSDRMVIGGVTVHIIDFSDGITVYIKDKDGRP